MDFESETESIYRYFYNLNKNKFFEEFSGKMNRHFNGHIFMIIGCICKLIEQFCQYGIRFFYYFILDFNLSIIIFERGRQGDLQ